jgi:hypothetical protein
MKTISTLPEGFFSKYLRSQTEEVKQNVYKGLGVFCSRDVKSTEMVGFKSDENNTPIPKTLSNIF